jgi:hypothetical protein
MAVTSWMTLLMNIKWTIIVMDDGWVRPLSITLPSFGRKLRCNIVMDDWKLDEKFGLCARNLSTILDAIGKIIGWTCMIMPELQIISHKSRVSYLSKSECREKNNCEFEICGCQLVTFPNWAPIFDWHVVRWGLKGKCHKDKSLKGIWSRL